MDCSMAAYTLQSNILRAANASSNNEKLTLLRNFSLSSQLFLKIFFEIPILMIRISMHFFVSFNSNVKCPTATSNFFNYQENGQS